MKRTAPDTNMSAGDILSKARWHRNQIKKTVEELRKELSLSRRLRVSMDEKYWNMLLLCAAVRRETRVCLHYSDLKYHVYKYH